MQVCLVVFCVVFLVCVLCSCLVCGACHFLSGLFFVQFCVARVWCTSFWFVFCVVDSFVLCVVFKVCVLCSLSWFVCCVVFVVCVLCSFARSVAIFHLGLVCLLCLFFGLC